MRTALNVLIIENTHGAGAHDAQRLEARGHRTHSCNSESSDASGSDALCVGITEHGCPLDHGIDVALLVRPQVSAEPRVSEAGVRCALHAGVPVVEDGPEALDPFAAVLTGRVVDDVAASCAAAADASFDRVRAEFAPRIAPLLQRAGLDPGAVSCDIETRWPRLSVTLRGPALSNGLRQSLAVRLLDTLRLDRRRFVAVEVRYEATDAASERVS